MKPIKAHGLHRGRFKPMDDWLDFLFYIPADELASHQGVVEQLCLFTDEDDI